MNKINLQRDWFILSSLVSKDFKLKYRRSLLGVAWSVLNPLLMMIVLTVVFSYMFRFQIMNFPVYLILGQTLFNFMTASTTSGMTAIIGSASLIKKIRINKTLFPLEKVVFELVNFVVSLIAVAAVIIFFYFFPSENNPQIVPTLNLFFLPLLIVFVFLFCTGLAFILASTAVFFRDTIHLWGIVCIAWTYLTPLFYPVESLQPWMQSIMNFNPMFHYVTYFRDIALYGTTPSLLANVICLGSGLVVLALGILVFRKTQKKFILFV